MKWKQYRRNKYEIDMCNGTIMDKLISFALPLMVSSILQLLFNAVDIIVVGRFWKSGTGGCGFHHGIDQYVCQSVYRRSLWEPMYCPPDSMRQERAGDERDSTYGDDFCIDQRYRHGIS